MILTCYISIDAIDNQLLEAARSLGAGKLTILFRLIVPLALPGIIAGSVLIFIPVIGSFMEPRLLGGRNGPSLVLLSRISLPQFSIGPLAQRIFHHDGTRAAGPFGFLAYRTSLQMNFLKWVGRTYLLHSALSVCSNFGDGCLII